jgi:hypothetical protein
MGRAQAVWYTLVYFRSMSLEFSLPLVIYGMETLLSVPASTLMVIGTSSFFVLLPAHPLPYVGRTTEDCVAFCLTDSEEAHDPPVHERHFVQVQHNPESAALHLCLQLLEMLRLHVANQPDRCVLPVRILFNS